MHDDGVALGKAQPIVIELVVGDIGRQIEIQSGETLFLDAQHHDHIDAANRRFKVTGNAKALRQRSCYLRAELGRSAQANLRAEFAEHMNGGAGDAAFEEVPHGWYPKSLENFPLAQDGKS